VGDATLWGSLSAGEAVLTLFMAGTWWWVVRRKEAHEGWRRSASLAGLALPTVALFVQLALDTEIAYYGSLAALDEASLHGGSWSKAGDVLWLSCFLAARLLPLCGLILSMVGKGSLRLAGALWSILVLGTFLVNFVLAVNSFHGNG